MFKIIKLFTITLLLISCHSIFLFFPSFCKEKNDTRFIISAGISPVADLVRRVIHDAQIITLLPENASPANYDPSPSQLLSLSRSTFLFIAGTPFEVHLARKLGSMKMNLKIVNLSIIAGLENTGGTGCIHEDADHNKIINSTMHTKHLDPHFWLSPSKMITALEHITELISKTRPLKEKKYKKNMELLKLKLKSLDEKIKSALEPYHGKKMFVYHPAFGYIAQENHIKQISIEQEGKKPGAKYLKDYLSVADEMKIKTIFVQKQFPVKTARSLATHLGCKVVYLNPMFSDYFNDMITLFTKIKDNI
jgi:zinc transport system substrate-binding protein